MAAVVLLSVCANLAWFTFDRNYLAPDSPQYLANARSLRAGVGLLDANGDVETRRTPGYSWVLSLLLRDDGSLRAVVLFQHLLWVILAAGTFLFARSRLGREAAFAAGLICALYLPSIIIANEIMSETLFALLANISIAAAVLAAERGSIAFASVAGIAGGFASITRPIGLFALVPLVLAILFCGRLRRFAVASALLITYLAAPVAWAARNEARTGIFAVSSIGGESLLFWKAAGSVVVSRHSLLWGLGALQLDNGFFFEFRHLQPQLERSADESLERALGRPASEIHLAVKSREYARQGREILRRHPAPYAALAVSGFVHMWVDGYWEVPTRYLGFDVRKTASSLFLVGCAMLAAALVGLRLLWRSNRILGSILMSSLAYYTVIALGPESDWRFTAPILPMYAIAAGAGIVRIYDVLRQRARRMWGEIDDGAGNDRP